MIETWETLHEGDWVLNVISATDRVRDRLAAAIQWRDMASVRQAAAVARCHPIDVAKIQA